MHERANAKYCLLIDVKRGSWVVFLERRISEKRTPPNRIESLRARTTKQQISTEFEMRDEKNGKMFYFNSTASGRRTTMMMMMSYKIPLIFTINISINCLWSGFTWQIVRLKLCGLAVAHKLTYTYQRSRKMTRGKSRLQRYSIVVSRASAFDRILILNSKVLIPQKSGSFSCFCRVRSIKNYL